MALTQVVYPTCAHMADLPGSRVPSPAALRHARRAPDRVHDPPHQRHDPRVTWTPERPFAAAGPRRRPGRVGSRTTPTHAGEPGTGAHGTSHGATGHGRRHDASADADANAYAHAHAYAWPRASHDARTARAPTEHRAGPWDATPSGDDRDTAAHAPAPNQLRQRCRASCPSGRDVRIWGTGRSPKGRAG